MLTRCKNAGLPCWQSIQLVTDVQSRRRLRSSSSSTLVVLRNDLYCVGWGVKLYSIQSNPGDNVDTSCDTAPPFFSSRGHPRRCYIRTCYGETAVLDLGLTAFHSRAWNALCPKSITPVSPIRLLFYF